MAYNGAPGAYGAPGYGQWPPGAAPPGMAGPPGASPATGSALTPNMAGLPPRPVGLPSGFAPLQNIPNFNPNAPVIRLGVPGPNKDGQNGRRDHNSEPYNNRRGIGMDRNVDQQRQQMRENMMAMQPPTREEIARTIFIGNITEGVGGDAGIERILRAVGGLRRWTRAFDAQSKPLNFGFGEFENAESLQTAAEVLKDVQVPLKKVLPKTTSDDVNMMGQDDVKPKFEDADVEMVTEGSAKVKLDEDVKMTSAEDEDATAGTEEEKGAHLKEPEVEKATLLVVVDEASQKYAEDWSERRGEDEATIQWRNNAAKSKLSTVLADLFNPLVSFDGEQNGDVSMQDPIYLMPDPETGEYVHIAAPTVEDELSDIPADMREIVAAEISAFRERSIRRDMDRLKREEQLEARERGSARGIPSGPSAGTNNIPLGPRDRGVAGAPSGPKAKMQGGQMPKDYQNGVNFINGNSTALSNYITKEEEESDASDEELERRRRAKKDKAQDEVYSSFMTQWEHRERSRAAAMEREEKREQALAIKQARDKENMTKRLKEWDDVAEASKKNPEEYYRDKDHSLWLRNRASFRQQEQKRDDIDRQKEEREQASVEQAKGMADSFLDRQAEEFSARGLHTAPRTQQRVKISLGAAMQKAKEAAAPKRSMVDVEGLLDNEDEEGGMPTKRTLVPIKFDTRAEGAALTDEERKEAKVQLAGSIPTETGSLFKFPIKWEFLEEDVIKTQLRPVVEKKVLDFLGMQEDMLVDTVEDELLKHSQPGVLVKELEPVLEQEAEALVKKLWRMIAFITEAERRGLNIAD